MAIQTINPSTNKTEKSFEEMTEKAELPFGGTKCSGHDRELSELGIDEFVNKKLIRVSELTDPF